MTKHVHSIPPHMNKSRRRSVKPFRSNERKRIRRNNQRHDARPSKAIKLKSSAMLVARSEELLKGLLEKYGSTTTRLDIFKGLLRRSWVTNFGACDASIGRKIWRLRLPCIISSLASAIL